MDPVDCSLWWPVISVFYCPFLARMSREEASLGQLVLLNKPQRSRVVRWSLLWKSKEIGPGTTVTDCNFMGEQADRGSLGI